MRAKFTGTLSFLLLLILLSPATVFAQLFGSDEKNWKKVFLELKKINHRLVTLETEEMDNVKNHLENLLREIGEIKHTVPQLHGAVELHKSETLSGLNKTNAKLDDFTAEVKNQVLNKIRQQNKNLELLREGLSQDMEKFEQASKTNFQEFATVNNKTLGQVVQGLEAQSATAKKGFDDTIALFRTDVIPAMAEESQTNRKIIMDQLAQANKDTQKSLEGFSAKNQQLNQKLIEILQESLKQGLDTKSLLDAIKKDMADSHSVIAEVQKALVVTNKNLIVADEKTNKLAKSLKALQVQNKISNEVLGVLKADMEQAKLDPVATLSDIQKEQKILQKAQAGFMKDQAAIKEALADLRRKANVNISRSDDIKKILGKLGPPKK